MQKRDFEIYQKRFQDFKILPKFSTFFEVPFSTPQVKSWGAFHVARRYKGQKVRGTTCSLASVQLVR